MIRKEQYIREIEKKKIYYKCYLFMPQALTGTGIRRCPTSRCISSVILRLGSQD